ncbi:hypothetical protein, partial [Pelomonas sp. KK5]|uniref:hypothetical protein n=1 Tax=Pelomonas sp. KK5 TaxID=1855730 RepID=UPI0018E95B58
ETATTAPPPSSNAITPVPADAVPAPAAARPAPLNLALPAAPPASAPLRNPALDDPRANTRRASLETRIANTVGDGALHEEALGPGRNRFRQGSSCVETAQSRIAQIDPMNETMRGSPRLVTPCK